MSSEKNGTQKKAWWEQEDKGYNTDSKVNTEFLWEDKTKRIIKERMGVVGEDSDDDDSKIEGEEEDNYEEDGERRVNKSKENNDDEDDEDNEDNEKGHQKRHSKRKKGR